ncbi:MAG: 2-oxoacid:acceptor oxidoreductase family protein [Planctomycetia bacterium]|nr:2-oxoacid:acceptor oxidoreductase family protein [Planctomycetia bacterium]
MKRSEPLEKPASFFASFDRKGKNGNLQTTHYCPGCGHGIVHKLLAQSLDDLEIQDKTILIAPVGCAVFMYYYFETACISSPHGRAPALATAVSRCHSDAITISYQGDGDLAAIGTSHIIHAANRGENMIVIFINNSNYGMTGGQMAPTTLLGQKTTTSPYGRSLLNDGPPIKMAELIAGLESPILVARSSISSPKNILETKKLIQRGLQAQKDQKGFVFLEILAPCPTNWHKTPVEACRWIDEEVVKIYPLGILKDVVETRQPQIRKLAVLDFQTVIEKLDIRPTKMFDRMTSLNGRELRIKIAGFGGQGVLSLGHAFANLALQKGLEVTWLPSYGPEVRGGVANCSVVLSEKMIGSPIVERPNILIAMNKPSLFRFAPLVSDQGIIFYNGSMIDQVPDQLAAPLYRVEASDLAIQAGNVKMANTVFLAAVSKHLNLYSLDELHDYIDSLFTEPNIHQKNRTAVDLGWNSEIKKVC